MKFVTNLIIFVLLTTICACSKPEDERGTSLTADAIRNNPEIEHQYRRAFVDNFIINYSGVLEWCERELREQRGIKVITKYENLSDKEKAGYLKTTSEGLAAIFEECSNRHPVNVEWEPYVIEQKLVSKCVRAELTRIKWHEDMKRAEKNMDTNRRAESKENYDDLISIRRAIHTNCFESHKYEPLLVNAN